VACGTAAFRDLNVSVSYIKIQPKIAQADKKVSWAYFARVSRKKPKSYHHGDLKRELVAMSIELLEAGGPDALSVAEVGRRLGVSSAAPYKHFRDRKELLRAVAAEGNRQLNEAIGRAVATECDPTVAFSLAGVAYVEWATMHPNLYRVAFDPENIDFDSTDHEGLEAPAVLEKMTGFWPDLKARLASAEPLLPTEPLISELAGRALAHGLASLFVSGIFESLHINSSQARRLARAVMGISAEPSAD
jgi:AcrR family transcriptional regulator